MTDPRHRAEVVRRRLAFEADPVAFRGPLGRGRRRGGARIVEARRLLPSVVVPTRGPRCPLRPLRPRGGRRPPRRPGHLQGGLGPRRLRGADRPSPTRRRGRRRAGPRPPTDLAPLARGPPPSPRRPTVARRRKGRNREPRPIATAGALRLGPDRRVHRAGGRRPGRPSRSRRPSPRPRSPGSRPGDPTATGPPAVGGSSARSTAGGHDPLGRPRSGRSTDLAIAPPSARRPPGRSLRGRAEGSRPILRSGDLRVKVRARPTRHLILFVGQRQPVDGGAEADGADQGGGPLAAGRRLSEARPRRPDHLRRDLGPPRPGRRPGASGSPPGSWPSSRSAAPRRWPTASPWRRGSSSGPGGGSRASSRWSSC